MMHTLRITLAVFVTALAVIPAAAAGGEYTPFVTDFPKAQPGSDAEKIEGYVARGYVPFVSDFPAPRPGSDAYKITGAVTRTPAVTVSESPTIAWGDFGIGLAVGLGLAGLLAAAALAARSRRAAHA